LAFDSLHTATDILDTVLYLLNITSGLLDIALNLL
jgi:hypothetical protein